MKKIFLLTLVVICSLHVSAQKSTPLKLQKGQIITITYSSVIGGEMLLGLQVKSNTNCTYKLTVIGETDSTYILSDSLKKMTYSSSMMGEEENYDSEKPGDRETPIGKKLSQKLYAPDTILLNKKDRTYSILNATAPEETEEDTSNPAAAMLNSTTGVSSEQAISNLFFTIPEGKKEGDNWKDSLITKELKTNREYNLQSMKKGIATMHIATTDEVSTNKEAMGMQIEATMTTKSTIDMIVDSKTGLVQEKIVASDMNGNMKAMGQDMPVSIKGTTTFTYQY